MNGIWKIRIGTNYHVIRADMPYSMNQTLSVYFDDNLIYKSFKLVPAGELYKFEKFGHIFTIKIQGFGYLGKLKLDVNGRDADNINELPILSDLKKENNLASPNRQPENQEEQTSLEYELETSNLFPKNGNIQKRELRVFLCHSSVDKTAVERYYTRLLKIGISPWLDKKSLLPGQNWQIEIPKAVKNSDVVIVFLSSHFATKEGYVQKEIKIALDAADEKPDGTIFIIPAKLEVCEVPERLANIQWVDLFENNGYEMLVRALQIRAESLGIVLDPNSNSLTK